jgi:hypothetical protein
MLLKAEKISIKPSLDKVATPRLSVFGFSYIGKRGHLEWNYCKEVGEINQIITFQQSNLSPFNIRINFNTSINSTLGVSGDSFVQNKAGWWIFTDQISLEKMINELVDIAINYGFKWLETMSIPDILPSEYIMDQFREEPGLRAKKFAEKYKISIHDVSSVKDVEQILLEAKNNSDNVDWDLILQASAYMGELVRYTLGGTWGWNHLTSTFSVNEVGGKKNVSFNSLKSVSKFWGKPEFKSYSLEVAYQNMKRFATL